MKSLRNIVSQGEESGADANVMKGIEESEPNRFEQVEKLRDSRVINKVLREDVEGSIEREGTLR